jgi:hypothetical protein
VATQGTLGEHQAAIYRDLEHATGRLDQAYIRIRKRLLELGRQTGGPGLIASDDAEFDSDLHVPVSVRGRSVIGRTSTA